MRTACSALARRRSFFLTMAASCRPVVRTIEHGALTCSRVDSRHPISLRRMMRTKIFCERFLAPLAIGWALVGCNRAGPPPGMAISVAVTETQSGPDICITGTNFSPNGPVKTTLIGIPNAPSSTPGPVGVASSTGIQAGSFLLKDSFHHIAACEPGVAQQTVVVSAMDQTTGTNATDTVSAGLWCSNTLQATNVNGGCH